MPQDEVTDGAPDRRAAVLESAMRTFVRHGYRKTSMDDVAAAARISRPGLYFLFASKPVLFREAATQALDRDLAAIEDVLADVRSPLRTRVVAAFDRWAGSYLGPLTGGLPGAPDFDPALLGEVLETAPRRFEDLVTAAIAESHPADAVVRARTLISASIGITHRELDRDRYVAAISVAVDLIG